MSESPQNNELSPAPWVGPDYQSGGALGLRLLVVAEPRARGAGDVLQLGQAFQALLTERYISGALKHQLFTHVARLCLGEPAPRQDCEAFWNSVAFSNLVEPSSAAPRATPSEEEWRALERRWPELLGELEPQAILVLGDELWERLGSFRKMEDRASTPRDVFPLPGGGAAIGGRAPHPASRDFDWRRFAPEARALLEGARR